MDDTRAILTLMSVKGLGPKTLSRVLAKCSLLKIRLAEVVGLAPPELESQFSIRSSLADQIPALRERAEQMADRLELESIRVVWSTQPRYPARIRHTLREDAPPVLFMWGNAELLTEDRRAVAVVGARDASDQGLDWARQLAGLMASRGVLVVSGHAGGVDTAAHAGALAAPGGTTALVLAEGLFAFRPKSNLSDHLDPSRAVVVSEFLPDQRWSVHQAMQRNATVCGLSDVTVVVEAGIAGGTVDAATRTLNLGHPLFVVRYASPPDSASGNEALVRRGGRPLPETDRVEADLMIAHALRGKGRVGDQNDSTTLFG